MLCVDFFSAVNRNSRLLSRCFISYSSSGEVRFLNASFSRVQIVLLCSMYTLFLCWSFLQRRQFPKMQPSPKLPKGKNNRSVSSPNWPVIGPARAFCSALWTGAWSSGDRLCWASCLNRLKYYGGSGQYCGGRMNMPYSEMLVVVRSPFPCFHNLRPLLLTHHPSGEQTAA